MRKMIVVIIVVLIISVSLYLFNKEEVNEENVTISNYENKSIVELEEYVSDNGFVLEKRYEYSLDVSKDLVISQEVNDVVIKVIVSLGIDPNLYSEYAVNELGEIPVMMYHGIVDVDSTSYIGGNVDKNGYNRTANAFREDLEFYYQSGYRMIRLSDYVDGIIDVEIGKSPIVLTFDDGREDNFKVLGLDENGEIIIDPNSAVGILESFKEKYPDYGVTATFFLNKGLFNQVEYNNLIIEWLIDNGYDIGNHTVNHVDFTNVNSEVAQSEVVEMYQILDNIIPDKFVNIIALPFGSPYNMNHDNFDKIINASYDGSNYSTKTTLRVGWKPEVSCFSKDFNPLFIKRVRAYDNKGLEFDIEMVFKSLETNRYISDGSKEKIVVSSDLIDFTNNVYELEIVTY